MSPTWPKKTASLQTWFWSVWRQHRHQEQTTARHKRTCWLIQLYSCLVLHSTSRHIKASCLKTVKHRAQPMFLVCFSVKGSQTEMWSCEAEQNTITILALSEVIQIPPCTPKQSLFIAPKHKGVEAFEQEIDHLLSLITAETHRLVDLVPQVQGAGPPDS